MKNLFNTAKVVKGQISRRNFLKSTAIAGGGFSLGMYLPALADTTSGEEKMDSLIVDGHFEPNAFIRIFPDNKILILSKHLEMGQGIYTGMATLVAEELDADWSQIKVEASPANAEKYKNLAFGSQGTGGSTSIANSFMQMRQAGAAAKQMLVNAAAEKWSVDAAQVSVENGMVKHADQSATFGELAEIAAKQSIPENVELKTPEQFRLIGKANLSRKDTGKTDGSAIFTQDFKVDGMMTAVVAHPPQFGASVKSFDATDSKAIPGVVDVVQIPNGVAALAPDYWTAKKARDAIKIEWDISAAMTQSSQELMNEYKTLAQSPGAVARNDGDADGQLGELETVIEADFEFPLLAHAAMEPMNAVVEITDKGCTITSGAQLQTGDQYAIGGVLGLPPEQVTINTVFAGGSFGRRGNPVSDYMVEAANIAKAVEGRYPVKLVWSREDDMRGGFYRPMYLHRLKAGLDGEGKLKAWKQTIVGQSIAAGTPFEQYMVTDGVDATSVEGAVNLPYTIPNYYLDLHTTASKIPVLWWRSVGSTHTAYVGETMIDELAAKAGVDPVDFRLAMLDKHPRHAGVLKLVAEKAGWGQASAEDRFRGIALHESFSSYVAQVAEISMKDDGNFKVEKIVCAVDCGVAVNPDIIKAQVEGAIGYGLSAALMSELTLENGAIKQSNFHDYQVLRINDMPDIEVHIVPSTEPPTGIGEPGLPPVAPAVANALAAATGKRYYKLPLRSNLG